METNINLDHWLKDQYRMNNNIDYIGCCIRALDEYNSTALKEIIIDSTKKIKNLNVYNKEIKLKFYIEKTKITNLDTLYRVCPIIKQLLDYERANYILFNGFKVGIDDLEHTSTKIYISLYIDRFFISSVKDISQNSFELFGDFLECVRVLDLVTKYNIEFPYNVKLVSIDKFNKYYNSNDQTYLAVCNEAELEEEKSEFSIKTLDCYLLTEKKWFIEQCEHLLHIANIMDGLDENDLENDNWTINPSKSNKIINSLKYRTNPFNKNKYIIDNYPFSGITLYDVQTEQEGHIIKLKNLYNIFNTFLYSSVSFKEYNKTVDSPYNEYTPYSIYRLSKEQYNNLCKIYNIEQKNILLEQPYDFIDYIQ